MVKLADLKIPQLKNELQARNLAIDGSKANLQSRLRDAMEAEGIDADEFDFEVPESSSKTELKSTQADSSLKLDTNAILAAIKQMSTENSTAMSQMSVQLRENSSQMEARFMQLQEQLTSDNAQIRQQVEKFEDKLRDLKRDEEELKSEVLQLSSRVRDLQVHSIAAPICAPKHKAPMFDGSVPLQIFKLQFEKTAVANNWNTEDKVAALFISLKGSAAEILQTIPQYERENYDTLMSALERRFGSQHRQQIYQIELQNRCQNSGETLQNFAADVERLAHLANADASVDYIERVKIQSFINGIRDVDTKRAALVLPKRTFAETVSHALTQETASLATKPIHK
ncbi:uncharacterized protein LOC119662995, partial [Teleopsis dalmanni]|uniref:uncharacterized protein LOC119662995 n=1 Tax=Teleopsis dalmanni TaxID=139649 RepID=UPI0018CDE55F